MHTSQGSINAHMQPQMPSLHILQHGTKNPPSNIQNTLPRAMPSSLRPIHHPHNAGCLESSNHATFTAGCPSAQQQTALPSHLISSHIPRTQPTERIRTLPPPQALKSHALITNMPHPLRLRRRSGDTKRVYTLLLLYRHRHTPLLLLLRLVLLLHRHLPLHPTPNPAILRQTL